MNLMTQRRNQIAGGSVILLVMAGLVAWLLLDRDSQESLAIHTGHESVRTDFTDDRKLVGFADDVFFATVISKDGQTLEYGWPETQYTVRVLEVLQGSMAAGDTATVNEAGGGYEDGTPYRVAGEHIMLATGKHYLLMTRSFPEKDWNTLITRYGRFELDVGGKGIDPLTTDDANALRARFTDAVDNKIPYDRKTFQGGSNK